MSDDQSPPDFIDTADFPLDESVLKPISAPPLESDQPPTGGDVSNETTLFAEARPLGLDVSSLDVSGDHIVDEGSILEDATRSGAPGGQQPEAVGPLKAVLAAGRDHSRPLYRRQSTVAAAVLLALAAIVAITFPWSELNLDSELEAGAVPAPASGTPDGNAGGEVNSLGSEGFFARSNSDAEGADAEREGDVSTAALEAGAKENDDQNSDDNAGASDGDDGEADLETPDPSLAEDPEPDDETTTTEQPETSVFVGPGLSGCLNPGALSPLCPNTTTTIREASPTTNPGDGNGGSAVVTTEAPTTTEEPTTTERQTTTTRPTTAATPTTLRTTTTAETTEPPTTIRPTTTGPTTTRPTTNPSSTGPTTATTEDPTSTSTQATISTTTTTIGGSTTDPSTPDEDDGPTPTAVSCDGSGGGDDDLPTPPSTEPCQPPDGGPD